MARRKRSANTSDSEQVNDFRHPEAQRKNNPPAGLAHIYGVPKRETTRYAYEPRLDPQNV